MERFQQQKSDLKTKKRRVLCQGWFENMKGKCFPTKGGLTRQIVIAHGFVDLKIFQETGWFQGTWWRASLSASIFGVQFNILNLLLLIGSCSASPDKSHAIHSEEIQSIFIFTFIVSRVIVGYESTQHDTIYWAEESNAATKNKLSLICFFFFFFFHVGVYIYIYTYIYMCVRFSTTL